MGDVEEKIRELVEPVAESEGMELIHVECVKMQPRWVIRLFIDKEGGVTLDDCTEISNQTGDILDVHDVPPGPYTLEVSSPGLDRPLSRDKDFLCFKGSQVNIKTGEKLEGMKNFQGVLVDYIEVNGKKTLMVDVAGKVYEIPRDLVVKANIRYAV